MGTSLHRKIFTRTGCVSREKLMAYCNNELSRSEKHAIQKHLLDCPLCMEALDGYERAGVAPSVLSDIDQKIDALITQQQGKPDRNYRWILAAAATVAIILTTSILLFFKHNDNQMAERVTFTKDKQWRKDKQRNINEMAAVRTNIAKQTKHPESKKGESNPSAMQKQKDMPAMPNRTSSNILRETTANRAMHTNASKREDRATVPEAEDEQSSASTGVFSVSRNQAMARGGISSEESAIQNFNQVKAEARSTETGKSNRKEKESAKIKNKSSYRARQKESAEPSSPVFAKKKNKVLKANDKDYKVVEYTDMDLSPVPAGKNNTATSSENIINDSLQLSYEPVTLEKASSLRLDYDAFLHNGLEKYDASLYKDALQQFDLLLQYHPADINALYYRGMSLFYLKRYDEAIEDFTKVIEQNKATFNEEVIYYRALCYANTGDIAKAKAGFLSVIKTGGFFSDRAKKDLQQIAQ